MPHTDHQEHELVTTCICSCAPCSHGVSEKCTIIDHQLQAYTGCDRNCKAVKSELCGALIKTFINIGHAQGDTVCTPEAAVESVAQSLNDRLREVQSLNDRLRYHGN